MLRATWRSLLARKLRLALSGLAIVLGVAFVSGAFVLTDTLGQVFDRLFSSVNAKTDAVVPRRAGAAREHRAGAAARRRSSSGSVPWTASPPPSGSVSGLAQVVLADGTAFRTGGAPTFGQNFDPTPELSPYTLRCGRGPTTPDEIALDATTAARSGLLRRGHGSRWSPSRAGPTTPWSASSASGRTTTWAGPASSPSPPTRPPRWWARRAGSRTWSPPRDRG